MTTRYLKIDNEWIMGKNSKKLRYIINKDDSTIVLKFASNWSENAFDDLSELYPEYSVVEDSTKKRGRPVKKIHRKEESTCKLKSAAIYDTDDEIDYEIGDRVKSTKDGLLGVGEIIEFNNKYAKIRFNDKLLLHLFSNITLWDVAACFSVVLLNFSKTQSVLRVNLKTFENLQNFLIFRPSDSKVMRQPNFPPSL